MIGMGARGKKPAFTDVACPYESCPKFGVKGEGNIVSNGVRKTKSGDDVRYFKCRICNRSFTSRTGTAYEHIHHSQESFDRVARCLCNGAGVRQTGRIEGISPTTVIDWTRRAGRHAAGVSAELEKGLKAESIQFDEMTVVVRKNSRRDGTGDLFDVDGSWIWSCIESYRKYMFGMTPGDRSEETGRAFMNSVWDKMDLTVLPVMLSDGYRVYRKVIDERFFVDWSYTNIRGRTFTQRIPRDDLAYGQVIKSFNGRKMEKVERRVVYGPLSEEEIETAYIERSNLTNRNDMARAKRKSITFSKSMGMLAHAVELDRFYYNYCRGHRGLRNYVKGGFKTPAMAMGITKHKWQMSDLFGFILLKKYHT